MGSYDGKAFSKEFSMRTEANLNYISNIVNREEKVINAQKDFLEKYKVVISEIDLLGKSIREEANSADNASTKKKGKNELKTRLHGIATKLLDSKIRLEKELQDIVATDSMQGEKLYEVTQLLNSLMGIAVLPYEMHKEYFLHNVEEKNKSEENKGKTRNMIQGSLRNEPAKKDLEMYIMDLYDAGKWKSTFTYDFESGSVMSGSINRKTVTFNFLRHLRNVICHAGNNALSILPLTEGKIIEEVLFYDNYENQEFALRLSIKELDALVLLVSRFYCETPIGNIDKSKDIKNAEEKALKLLNG